jgi:hypothetical protein
LWSAGPPARARLRNREDAAIGKTIAYVVLLLAGSWSYAALALATAGNIVLPPQEIVVLVRVVDRTQSRIILGERSLERGATDPRQLDGLVPGQKVRVRSQERAGRQILYSIAPRSQ